MLELFVEFRLGAGEFGGEVGFNISENAFIKGNPMDFVFILPSSFCDSQYGLQRILGDERSLLLLARSIDPKQTHMMTETVKILSAFCIIGEENMWVFFCVVCRSETTTWIHWVWEVRIYVCDSELLSHMPSHVT